jgi:DNA-binding GntR family transcriptional regulator
MPVPDQHGVSRRALLRDEVFQRLRAAIVDGTLQPGERLRDAELERWLGVSRTPIREALGRLEQVGLVQTEPGRSTRVSPVDLRDVSDAQAVCAAMHVLAVREAVPRLSQPELHAMRQANERFAAALRSGDVEAALSADDAFHDVAVQAAGNQAAQAVLAQYGPVLRRVERLRFASLSGRGSVAQHEQVLRACEAGDADAAVVATWRNWQALEPLLPRVVATEPPGEASGPGAAAPAAPFRPWRV